MASKIEEHVVENETWHEVEKPCTTCVEIDAAEPLIPSLAIEKLQQITKSEGADKWENMSKKAVEISSQSLKI